jgi:hypothetical protein
VLARWPEGGGERSEVGPRGRSKAKRACLLKPNHKERSDGLSLGPLIEVQGSQTLEYLVPPKSEGARATVLTYPPPTTSQDVVGVPQRSFFNCLSGASLFDRRE